MNSSGQYKKIKYPLVFFCVILLCSCQDDPATGTLGLHFEDGRATAVSFMADPDAEGYAIYLSGEQETPVLGTFTRDVRIHTFIPAVPFSPGTNYVIRQGKDSIAGFGVPYPSEDGSPPELLGIYPSRDTVPENLLKCYLQFSEPMQAVGRAQDFIEVTDPENGETIAVFLDMEAELWDKAHSRLTLWLDPGRIKTDLVPNRTLGTPLKAGKYYEITISASWRSAKGIPLGREYSKIWHVGPPDRNKLQPDRWLLEVPEASSKEAVSLFFEEDIDVLMALEGSSIETDEGEIAEGEWQAGEGGDAIRFVPVMEWQPGEYMLRIDARLEDLAGNTVNRLFDTDLKNINPTSKPLLQINKPFIID